MRGLQHPNLLPLLAHSVTQQRHEGAALQVVYMLFPLYEVGAGQHFEVCRWGRWRCCQQCKCLLSVVECTSPAAVGPGLSCSVAHMLDKLQRPLPSPLPPRHAVLQDGSLVDLVSHQHAQRQHLPAQDILKIFVQVRPLPAQSCGAAETRAGPPLPGTGTGLRAACVLQVCRGVQAMHQARPPLAHRDIKYAAWRCSGSCLQRQHSEPMSPLHSLYCRPHNILLQQLHKASSASAEGDQADEEAQPMQVSS